MASSIDDMALVLKDAISKGIELNNKKIGPGEEVIAGMLQIQNLIDFINLLKKNIKDELLKEIAEKDKKNKIDF